MAMPAGAPATLAVPLRSILDRLPAELMQRVRQMEVGDSHVILPMQKVLSQISLGAVKISFGELRQLSPPGTFTNEGDRDRTPVEIPLHEILARLNPSLLPRRVSQRQVSVPSDVTGPFGGQAQVMFTTAPLKGGATVAPVQTAPRMQAPVAPSIPQRAANLNQPSSSTQTSFRTQAGTPPAPRPQPVQPVQPTQPAQPFRPPQPIQPARQTQAAPTMPPQHSFQFPRPAAPVVARVRTAPPVPPAAPARPVAAPQTAAPFWSTPPAAPQSDTQQAFFRKTAPAPIAPFVPDEAGEPAQQVYSPIAPEPVEAEQPVYSPTVAETIGEEQPAPIAMPEMPRVIATIAPTAPITPIAPEAEPEPTPIPFQMPAPTPLPIAEPSIAGETRFLTVSLAEVSRGWPETVLQEIKDHQMTTSAVGLPFGIIEAAMKQGRISLPWRVIRSWVKPLVSINASALDATLLEFPLRVVAPLFLAELRTSKFQKKIVLDENIPDLFSNRAPTEVPSAVPAVVVAPTPKSAPVAAVPPSPKPADTNYFSKNGVEGIEEPAPVVKKGPSPGTAFLVRYATPNEIVSKAAALEGVDGALIALPDGLLVASHIPQSMNADTVAAFLPQIFGRVTQCTKELRLGELNNLNFTVGTTPWKIFKVGAIYFAAFGRAGEPLPSAQLAGIAAELDRKAK